VDGVYVSVDIDCLDRAHAPGTSVPNIAGFRPHDVADGPFEIARRADVIGLDITEVSPPLDRDRQTSGLAALLVLHYMAGLARRS